MNISRNWESILKLFGENIQKSQLLLRKNISEEYFKGKRGAPPFNGKPPLLSDYQMLRMWFRDMDHWCTLNVGQPEYYILTEILRILEHAKKNNIFAGIHNGTPEYAKKMIDKGFNFVTVSADLKAMTSGAKEIVEKMKGPLNLKKTKSY